MGATLTQPDVRGEQVELSVSDEGLLEPVDKTVASNCHQDDVRVVGSEKHKSASFSVLLTQKVNPVLLPVRRERGEGMFGWIPLCSSHDLRRVKLSEVAAPLFNLQLQNHGNMFDQSFQLLNDQASFKPIDRQKSSFPYQ